MKLCLKKIIFGIFLSAYWLLSLNSHQVLAVDLTEAPTFISKIGAPRNGAVVAGFYHPKIVAVDAANNVYVSEIPAGVDFVQKFSASGELMTHLGGANGTGNGQFDGINGLAADTGGNIYVLDTYNQRVQKFDANGNFLLSWGSSGSGDGQLYYPNGLAVDSSDNVWVADCGNNRIQKFTSSGSFLTKWGSYGLGDGQFNCPYGIGLDPSNNVYVVDVNNYRIQKFNSSGTFLTKWGGYGTANGKFNFPISLAVDSSGNVYVVDIYNYRIQKFNSSGTFLTKWGSYSSTGEDGTFSYPLSVAVDSSSNVYVVDMFTNRLEEFDSSGTFIKQWGSAGKGDGEFNGPGGLAYDSNRNLYVVDIFNHRVQKFDSSGNFSFKWGSYGSGNGQFSYPMGIAIDASDNVYVAEQGNQRVQKFDSNGNYLTKWGSYGSGDGQLNNPVSMTVDSSDNVYVADSNNHRVQKFDAGGNFLTKWGSDGSPGGDFNAVDGIAVDPSGNLYVTDYDCHVHKLTQSGTFLARWGSCGSGNGQFTEPTGISLDSYGYVYVADNGNNRIQKFDSNGNYVTQWGGFGIEDGKFHESIAVKVDPSLDKVYVADQANNRVQVFGDAIPPTGSIITNSAYTNSLTITLSISALDNHDSDPRIQMQISNNSDFFGSSWEPYSTLKIWTLSSNEGSKTVYAHFKDFIGNISSVYSTNMTYDITAPSIPGKPATASFPTESLPVWSWIASSDSLSGLTAAPYTVQWSPDQDFLSNVSASTSTTNSFTHTTDLAFGVWYFRTKASDLANNDSSFSTAGQFNRHYPGAASSGPTGQSAGPSPSVSPSPSPSPSPLPTPGLIPIPEVPANPTPEQLQSAITAILQNINYLQSELQKLQPTIIQPFERDLYFGLTNDPEVKRLQEFLIGKGYLESGLNTGNFYEKTLEAVKAYQRAKAITPVSGYFGSKTRRIVNQELGI